MARETELNEEVLDAGVAYTLYAASLVNLAISLNKTGDRREERRAVSTYASRLHGALIRCDIQKDIPSDLGTTDEICDLLHTGSLMIEIANEFAGRHSCRQEQVFILACLLGGVFSGSVAGVANATRPARTQALSVANLLQVPRRVVERCFE